MRAITPPVVVGAVFASYWFYMTQMADQQSAIRLQWPKISLKLTLLLTVFCAVAAAAVVLLGNFHTSAAGIMVSLLFALGTLTVMISSAIRPHLGVCAMILTLPFAFLLHLNIRSSADTNGFGYIVISPEIVLVLITFIAVFMGLLIKKKGPVSNKIDIAIGIFLIGSLISFVNSPDLQHSSKILITGTMIPLLGYYAVVNGIRTRTEFHHVLASVLISFFMIGGYSLITFNRLISIEGLLSGELRLAQLVLNPGVFAVMLTLVLPISISLAVSSAVSPRVRLALVFLSVLLLAELVATHTRGAWVGFLVSGVVLLSYNEARRALLKISPMILTALLFGWGIISQVVLARSRSANEFLQSDSSTERLEAWRSAGQMIIHNPLSGVGPGMFRDSYYQYQVGYSAIFSNFGTNAHNLFLNVWAETGTIAVLGFGGMIIFTMWGGYNLFRSSKIPLEKSIALGLFAGLVGYIVSASLYGALLAQFTERAHFFTNGNTIYLFLILGLTVAFTHLKKPLVDSRDCQDKRQLKEFEKC
jgi:O-antigen ligase